MRRGGWQGVERVIAERGLLPDLEEPPARPLYGYGDKWTVSLRGPERFGPETVDVVVRPTQQARLLLKAWAQANGLAPAPRTAPSRTRTAHASHASHRAANAPRALAPLCGEDT